MLNQFYGTVRNKVGLVGYEDRKRQFNVEQNTKKIANPQTYHFPMPKYINDRDVPSITPIRTPSMPYVNQ